jgi:hypothetical protein
MKKFVFAAICTFTLVGFVVADEFTAVITKVDGKNISYYKTKADPDAKGGKGGGKKGGGGKAMVKDGDIVTAKVTDKVTVAKGTFNKDDMKFTAGDAIEGGLTADAFKNATEEKGVNVVITTASEGADKGRITQILQTGGGGKGGKKKGG